LRLASNQKALAALALVTLASGSALADSFRLLPETFTPYAISADGFWIVGSNKVSGVDYPAKCNGDGVVTQIGTEPGIAIGVAADDHTFLARIGGATGAGYFILNPAGAVQLHFAPAAMGSFQAIRPSIISFIGSSVAGLAFDTTGKSQFAFWDRPQAVVAPPGEAEVLGSNFTMFKVVGSLLNGGNNVAAKWTANADGLWSPTAFVAPHGDVTRAFGMSGDGSVAVGMDLRKNDAGTPVSSSAIVWDDVAHTFSLLPAVQSDPFEKALAVNCDGSVFVGESFSAANKSLHALLWDGEGVHDLRDLLIHGGATGLGDSPLVTAFGASADGLNIIGRNALGRGFLARVHRPNHIRFISSSQPVAFGNNHLVGHVNLDTVTSTDATINLTSDSATLELVPAVHVAAGSYTAPFTMTAHGVDVPTFITVTGQYNGRSMCMVQELLPAVLVSIKPSLESEVGGTPVPFYVFLTGGAGPHGVHVHLTSSKPEAFAFPLADIVIPSGANHFLGEAHTFSVSTSTVVTLTAASDFGIIVTATNTVKPALLLAASLSSETLVGGNPDSLHVTLNGPAGPNGKTITLAGNTAYVTLPASLLVPANATTMGISFPTRGVDAVVHTAVTASDGSIHISKALTLNPAALDRVLTSPETISAGNVTVTVILNGQAGPSGAHVSLTSSDPVHFPVPDGMNIHAYERSGHVTVAATTPDASETVTVTATYHDGTKTGHVTLSH